VYPLRPCYVDIAQARGRGMFRDMRRADSNWNLVETAAMRKTLLVIGDMLERVAHLAI
jgi:hypothetical protein